MVILIDVVDSKGEAAPGDLGGLPTSTEMQPLGCVWHQFHSGRKAARLRQTFLIPPSFHGTSARLRRVDVPSVAFVCAHWGDWWWKLLNGKKKCSLSLMNFYFLLLGIPVPEDLVYMKYSFLWRITATPQASSHKSHNRIFENQIPPPGDWIQKTNSTWICRIRHGYFP